MGVDTLFFQSNEVTVTQQKIELNYRFKTVTIFTFTYLINLYFNYEQVFN